MLQFRQERNTPTPVSTLTPHSAQMNGRTSITPSTGEKEERATVRSMGCNAILVKVYVREDLFPKRKFVISDADLDYSQLPSSIARQCLQYCNMEGPSEHQWWDTWKRLVKDELNHRRNHCQNYCKDAFMGKWGC